MGKLIKTLDLNLIESGGGHNMAAGFTIKKDNLSSFKNLYEYATQNFTYKISLFQKLVLTHLINYFYLT